MIDPVQATVFFGYGMSCAGEPAFFRPTREAGGCDVLSPCLHQGGSGARKAVASLAGQLLSLSLALAPARLYTRAMYRAFALSLQEGGGSSRICCAVSGAGSCPVNRGKLIQCWVDNLPLLPPRAAHRRAQAHAVAVFTLWLGSAVGNPISDYVPTTKKCFFLHLRKMQNGCCCEEAISEKMLSVAAALRHPLKASPSAVKKVGITRQGSPGCKPDFDGVGVVEEKAGRPARTRQHDGRRASHCRPSQNAAKIWTIDVS